MNGNDKYGDDEGERRGCLLVIGFVGAFWLCVWSGLVVVWNIYKRDSLDGLGAFGLSLLVFGIICYAIGTEHS